MRTRDNLRLSSARDWVEDEAILRSCLVDISQKVTIDNVATEGDIRHYMVSAYICNIIFSLIQVISLFAFYYAIANIDKNFLLAVCICALCVIGINFSASGISVCTDVAKACKDRIKEIKTELNGSRPF